MCRGVLLILLLTVSLLTHAQDKEYGRFETRPINEEFILDYLEEFGEKDEAGKTTAKNLLSHKEIANLTNTSRQTVSNVMSTMRKEGIIDYNAKHISKI